MASKNLSVSVSNMQKDLDTLTEWCAHNGIMANTDKTKFMMFGSSKRLEELPEFEVKMHNVPLDNA